MSVPSQQGIFGWADATDGDSVTSPGAGWYRHKATEVSFGGIQDLRTFPPEVGGELTPTGAYKNGLYGGGGVTLQPRVQEVIGHLLKAMMGAASISAAGTLSPVSVVNAGDPSVLGLLTLAGNPPDARILGLTTVGLDVASTFTLQLTGTDINNALISEIKVISANGIVSSSLAFKTVVAVDVLVAAVEAGGPAVAVSIGHYTAAPYLHTFKMAALQNQMGWLNLRKWIPGEAEADAFGETMIGARVTGMRLTIPASGIVTARIEFQGRRVIYAADPGWEDTDADWDPDRGNFEDTGSVPLASAVGGLVQLPTGTNAKVTSLIINWANNVSTPEQERIVGSPYPDDIIPLTRAESIQATVKWQDADLFAKIYTGANAAGAGAAGWVAKPFASDFLASVLAPDDIPGATTGTKYQLDVLADNVMWNCNGPITLAGADLVMMPIIGTVIRQTGSNPYARFLLHNARATVY